MNEGTCKVAKNGMEYCKINGRVRFTKKVRKGTSRKRAVAGVNTTSIKGLGDPVGVSLSALRALARGAKKCITAVTPQGIKSICTSAASADKNRKKAVSGLGRRKPKTRRRSRR